LFFWHCFSPFCAVFPCSSFFHAFFFWASPREPGFNPFFHYNWLRLEFVKLSAQRAGFEGRFVPSFFNLSPHKHFFIVYNRHGGFPPAWGVCSRESCRVFLDFRSCENTPGPNVAMWGGAWGLHALFFSVFFKLLLGLFFFRNFSFRNGQTKPNKFCAPELWTACLNTVRLFRHFRLGYRPLFVYL